MFSVVGHLRAGLRDQFDPGVHLSGPNANLAKASSRPLAPRIPCAQAGKTKARREHPQACGFGRSIAGHSDSQTRSSPLAKYQLVRMGPPGVRENQ